MQSDLPLFPKAASALAREVDAIYFVWSAISLFFALLIACLIVYFMVRYRRRDPAQVGRDTSSPIALEVTWSAVPLLITLVMFFWGVKVFFGLYRPPEDSVEYFATGKQWMWKFQHPEGNREINELHVPAGQTIKMTMTSEDVIHSFFVPAFRTKQDVLPDRYTTLWFQADRPGTYHMFCTEYCGAEHSKMVGSVIVMEPTAYEAWLAGEQPGRSLVASGADLFQSLACDTCHRESAAGLPARAPRLEGLYGNQVALANGEKIVADDDYIRESILNPQAKLVAGWEPIMPTFQGQVTEEQLVQLITYVRSLGGGGQQGQTQAGGGAAMPGGMSESQPGTGSLPATEATPASPGGRGGAGEQPNSLGGGPGGSGPGGPGGPGGQTSPSPGAGSGDGN